MTVVTRVGNSSTLLVSRVVTERRGSRLDLFRLVWVSIVHLLGPDFSRSDVSFVSNTVLVELVVVGASQEGPFLSYDLETPALTVVMRDILSDVLCTVDINCADSAVVMTHQDLALHVVN